MNQSEHAPGFRFVHPLSTVALTVVATLAPQPHAARTCGPATG
ncbi:hypothetical protein [Streptomyces sp. NPDC058086]